MKKKLNVRQKKYLSKLKNERSDVDKLVYGNEEKQFSVDDISDSQWDELEDLGNNSEFYDSVKDFLD